MLSVPNSLRHNPLTSRRRLLHALPDHFPDSRWGNASLHTVVLIWDLVDSSRTAKTHTRHSHHRQFAPDSWCLIR